MMDGRASYIDDAALLLQPSRAEGWTTAQAPKARSWYVHAVRNAWTKGPIYPSSLLNLTEEGKGMGYGMSCDTKLLFVAVGELTLCLSSNFCCMNKVRV